MVKCWCYTDSDDRVMVVRLVVVVVVGMMVNCQDSRVLVVLMKTI